MSCCVRLPEFKGRPGFLFSKLAQIFSQLTHLGSSLCPCGEQTFTKMAWNSAPVSFREANCSQGCGPTFPQQKAPPCGPLMTELRVQMRWMVSVLFPFPFLSPIENKFTVFPLILPSLILLGIGKACSLNAPMGAASAEVLILLFKSPFPWFHLQCVVLSGLSGMSSVSTQ